MTPIRSFIVAIFITTLAINTTPLWAQSHYSVNSADGTPNGNIDNNGNIYNADGTPNGNIDNNGNVYNADGTPSGNIDNNGNVYNADGTPRGNIQPPSGSSDTRAGFSKEQMLAALRLLHKAQ